MKHIVHLLFSMSYILTSLHVLFVTQWVNVYVALSMGVLFMFTYISLWHITSMTWLEPWRINLPLTFALALFVDGEAWFTCV